MLGPRCPKVSSTSKQKICETPKAPHHSSLCIEVQSNTQNFLPPPESHDPITHALKELYTASKLARHKLSLFLMFSCLSQSRECAPLSSTCNVSQHHLKFVECLSCASTLFFVVETFKLGLCWPSLLNLSCSLVYMYILFFLQFVC